MGISGTASPKAVLTVAVWESANAPVIIMIVKNPAILVTNNTFGSFILIVIRTFPAWFKKVGIEYTYQIIPKWIRKFRIEHIY
jgi:hypothetical protein